MTEAAEIWHVKLENGQVHTLTLDQLDAGYKDGWIRGRTPVLQAGAITWKPLRDVAGLDPSGPWEALPPSIAPQLIDVPVDVSFDTGEIPAELRPKKRGAAIFGVAIAIVAIGALGFAATRSNVVASAKSFVTSHLPGKTSAPAIAAAAPAKMETPKPADPPPPAPQPEPQLAAPVATMNVGALPPASPKKKGKRH
ncbi:MAG TPA: hypothetical protein VIF62_01840 [Labilithrix sp.]